MVEDAIRNTRNEFTKTKLWNSLPKKVQYQTFQVILSYLEQSNKITYTKNGKIIWIATNPKLDKIASKGMEY